jgi:hypothetical protein
MRWARTTKSATSHVIRIVQGQFTHPYTIVPISIVADGFNTINGGSFAPQFF